MVSARSCRSIDAYTIALTQPNPYHDSGNRARKINALLYADQQ